MEFAREVQKNAFMILIARLITNVPMGFARIF